MEARNLKNYSFCEEYVEEGDVVIDFNCGIGKGTEILCLKAKKVVGISENEKNIEIANRKHKKENNYFMVDNVDQAPGLPESDVAVCLSLLNKIRYPKSFLAKLKIATKKYICLTIFRNKEDIIKFINRHWSVIKRKPFPGYDLLICKK